MANIVRPSIPFRRNATVLTLLFLVLGGVLSGCESARYYGQAIGGHLELMRSRVPIHEALADPALPAERASQLRSILEARRFATEVLKLPDNASYTSYAPRDDDAMTYNVVATPEFSLQPRQWCFPIAGCVNYRGYFAQADAQRKAREHQQRGDDVVVTRAIAYSTLGWFDDPLPGPLVEGDIGRAVGLIFHELAHQQLYIKNDTPFNESYAMAVALLGLRQWQPALAASARARFARQQQVYILLQPTIEALAALYATDRPAAVMRAEKKRIFDETRARYAAVASDLPGWESYFAELNNARIIGLSDYTRGVAAFESLFAQCHGRWECFHAEARRIGESSERRQAFF